MKRNSSWARKRGRENERKIKMKISWKWMKSLAMSCYAFLLLTFAFFPDFCQHRRRQQHWEYHIAMFLFRLYFHQMHFRITFCHNCFWHFIHFHALHNLHALRWYFSLSRRLCAFIVLSPWRHRSISAAVAVSFCRREKLKIVAIPSTTAATNDTINGSSWRRTFFYSFANENEEISISIRNQRWFCKNWFLLKS